MQLISGGAEIAVIPAIESFQLDNAGILTHASMTFPERVTFVVRQRRAEGETTLITAMSAAAGLALPEGLPPILNARPMSICAKWEHKVGHARNRMDYRCQDPLEAPAAERSISVLRDLLPRVSRDFCIILGSECFRHFDQRHFPETIALLKDSVCQLIVFIPANKTGSFLPSVKPASIYEFVELPDQPECFRVEPSSSFNI